MKRVVLPLTKEVKESLGPGDAVLLTGRIYTARDAAHARMDAALNRGEPLPFDLKDACVYYTGPCPARPGQVIGSCGPTTSKRMNAYAPRLYGEGLGSVIGKGQVSEEVRAAVRKNKAVYFVATGGLGALIAKTVHSARVIAYPELLSEAVYELMVEDMPAYVAINSKGESIFER